MQLQAERNGGGGGGGGGVGYKILRPGITILRLDTHTCRRKGFIIRSERYVLQ